MILSRIGNSQRGRDWHLKPLGDCILSTNSPRNTEREPKSLIQMSEEELEKYMNNDSKNKEKYERGKNRR